MVMRNFKMIFLIFVFIFLSQIKSQYHPQKLKFHESITQLNTKNFVLALNSSDYTVVYFHRDSAYSEEDLQKSKEFSKAVSRGFKNNKKNIIFGDVSCLHDKDICQKTSIVNYPTIALFKDGIFNKMYQGEYRGRNIKQWIDRRTRSRYIIPYGKKFQKFASKQVNVSRVIGIFNANDEILNVNYKAFVEVTEQLDEVIFSEIISPDEKIRKKYGFRIMEEGYVVYPYFEDYKKFVKINGTVDSFRLAKMILLESFPLVDDLTILRTFDRLLLFPMPYVVILLIDYDNPHMQDYIDEVMIVAKKFKGDVSFAYADMKKYGGLYNRAVPREEDRKKNALLCMNKDIENERYVYEGDILSESDEIIQWVIDINIKKVDMSIISEEIPTEKENEFFTKVVAKNFMDVVYDRNKDVLVYYHTESCEYCKKVDVIVETLADYLKDIDDLVFAKMDGEKNDIPEKNPNAKVSQFPTFVFYPATDKKRPIKYKDKMSFGRLKHFIYDNADASKEETNALKREEEIEMGGEPLPEIKGLKKITDKRPSTTDEL